MNGERLKLARKRLGLSLRGLAARMNSLVSAQAIGKYERGEMCPSAEVLKSLSKVLGVSFSYLMAAQEVELEGVEFRATKGVSARARARVETEVIEGVEKYLQIEDILELNLEGCGFCSILPRRLKNELAAEELAEEVREEWQLGIDPISNMTELLEEKCVKVLLLQLPNDVSGLTCGVKCSRKSVDVPVIVVNKEHSLERRRFTLAHELGHLLIHPKSKLDIEVLCNRFAGAFLVNRKHLLEEIGKNRSSFSVREIMDIKRLYRISAAAFLIRLEQVGVLSPCAKERAFRSYAKQWRFSEPEPLESSSECGKFESPVRFERLVYRAVAEDLISLSKASELLNLPVAKVEFGIRGALGADNC